jgi:anti-sigma B factor antagonist
MQISTETFGHVLVAHTPDELNDENTPVLIDALEAPIESGQVNIVLQMDHTEQYDSVGLTSLVDLHERLREAGGNLKVSGLGDPGRKIFELTRLDQRFDLYDSVIDAVGSFQ